MFNISSDNQVSDLVQNLKNAGNVLMIKTFQALSIVLLILGGCPTQLYSDVIPNALFSDNMVLQRDQEILI